MPTALVSEATPSSITLDPCSKPRAVPHELMIVSAMNASLNCRILVTPLRCAPCLSAFKEQENGKYYVFSGFTISII